MKPEAKVKKGPELTDQEKEVLEALNKESKMELGTLKAQFDFSNKVWDKVLKGLSKKELTKVSKMDDVLTIEVLG